MPRRSNRKTPSHLRAHVRRRALARFGFEPTRDEIDAVVRQIQHGDLVLIDRQSTTVTRWFATMRDSRVAVVYDSARKTLRTVLPLDFIKNGQP
jgi:hypothetical protein